MRLITCVLLIVPLAACSASQDHYANQERTRLTATPRRLVIRDELRGNCAGLMVTLRTHIDRLRELQKKAKQQKDAPPATLLEMWSPPAFTPLDDERQRLAEFNAALEAKGCKQVDIDQEARLEPTPPAAGKTK
jgi:hypothetical protein